MHFDVGPGLKYDLWGFDADLWPYQSAKASYGTVTLTITGKAISGETRLLAVTALNLIMSRMQCEKVVLVHFLLPLAVFEHNMTHFSSQ